MTDYTIQLPGCELEYYAKGWEPKQMPQVLIEVPEILHDALKHYLELHPERSSDDAVAMGLCLFLMQHRSQTGQAVDVELQRLATEYLKRLLPKNPIPAQRIEYQPKSRRKQ